MTVQVRFLGTGNAFAAGGRSHACILVTHGGSALLLDCGGSALPAITRAIDPGAIDAVAVTHLHGDHFGGIPFLLMEQKYAPRSRPLVVAGPPSLESRVRAAGTAMFDDLFEKLPYPLAFAVLGPSPTRLGVAEVTAHPVKHVASAEPHGLRVRIGGKLIAYTGDAAWSDDLVELSDGADLFICEATTYSVRDPVHLSALDLAAHRADLRCSRIVLTHLGADALAHRDLLPFEPADEGTVLEL